jgi:cyclic-di-AMP phosphodiesterase PgpH
MGIGLLQALVYLFVALALSSSTPVWYLLLRGAAQTGLSGVLWSVFALGFSPYLERVFEVLTPIRLAELANLNRPLLQRLAAQTPGTFQHTLLVATLAEAAARELHCNVELIRAGTLYHDIGKMHDPLGFIENQMGGPNKHTQFDDPWQSAAIIKKHVTEGLVIARRAGLPKPLQAFIPEHQGTMLIAYFYHKAKALEAEDPEQYSAQEADFRYDGPIPQSRETGIVMLADSCEAALRSLKDVTADEALIMVRKIIRARWQDNQLVDSRLTRAEVERIAKVFVQIWQQFHHQRITYPTAYPTISQAAGPAPTPPASPS